MEQKAHIDELSEKKIDNEQKLDQDDQLNKRETRQLCGLAEQMDWVKLLGKTRHTLQCL